MFLYVHIFMLLSRPPFAQLPSCNTHVCVCVCACVRVLLAFRNVHVWECVRVSGASVIYIAIGQYMEAIAVNVYTLTSAWIGSVFTGACLHADRGAVAVFVLQVVTVEGSQ